jgi:hypothetical protein
MAALNKLQGILSLRLHAAAQVDSEGRATYAADLAQQISFLTGTGADVDDCDMLYTDRLDFTASQVAVDSIDLRALVQGGNSMVMVRPKVIILSYIEGDGTAFFDRGASNGYTGISADGHSVSKNQPITVLCPTVSTGSGDKTIATSETGAATVSVQVTILGSSA